MKASNIEILSPFVLSFEGGYVNDPDDKGGATNMGITLQTWKQIGSDLNADGIIDEEDIKLLTPNDAKKVLKERYWNRWRADEIIHQGIANIVVDWTYCSGKYGITIPQEILGVKVDGIVGPKTISAINNHQDPVILFEQLWNARSIYLHKICKSNPKNKKFLKGWLRRLDAISWNELELNTIPVQTIKF